MEMNPGTASKEKCRALYQMGINRLSIGLQSTNDMELKTLGRIHSYEDFINTYTWCREAGFQNINVDLMAALPYQTVESYTTGLRKIIRLAPEHISAYSLILEEGTPFYQKYNSGCYPLPDEEQERLMYRETEQILAQAGYERYEISNYAKKGMPAGIILCTGRGEIIWGWDLEALPIWMVYGFIIQLISILM